MFSGKFSSHYGKVGCLHCKWRGDTWELELQDMSKIHGGSKWETESCPKCGSTNVHKLLQANKDLKIDRIMGTSAFPIGYGTNYVAQITHTLNYILDSHFCKDIKITIDDSVYKFNIRETLEKLVEMGLAEKGELDDEIKENYRERGYQ